MGLPSEAELEQLARDFFPEFDPKVCASGLQGLAQGDTSVIGEAAEKAARAAQRYEADLNASGSVSDLGSASPYEQALREVIAAYEPQTAETVPQAAQESSQVRTAPAAAVSFAGGIAPQVVSPAQNDRLTRESPKAGGSAFGKPTGITVGPRSLDSIRADFPALKEQVNGHPLVWFDNGATTQRAQSVIDRISWYYTHENSNVHRGAHELAARSTDAYEDARQKVADFLGAPSKDNIVWVRGTTEGINLVAQAFVRPQLKPGDEIIVSLLEHHANIVPWQLIAQESGAVIKVIPVDERGDLRPDAYEALFTPRTRFVSVTQVSNTLGTITPVEELTAVAHRHGVPILIDGAQSAAHLPVNVSASGADFYVFSGHKMYGPNGIGAVYGRKELWEQARPYQGGGNMIRDVTFEKTVYNEAPAKFEAGTGSIADAVGLGAAVSYLQDIGMANVEAWEHELTVYAVKELSRVKGLTLIGNPRRKSGVLSFLMEGYPVTAVGEYLNRFGIAVRAGHHCAQPILRHFGTEGAVRPVLGLYNTPDEVDALVRALYALH